MKKLLCATAVAMALSGAAHATTIDGVTFNAGAQFITTSLWETVLTAPTETLSGIGVVNQVDNTSGGGTTWINGQNNTQLTYYFTGYTVNRWYGDSNGDFIAEWNASGVTTGFAGALAIDFVGGNTKFFADNITTGTVLNPSAVGSTIPVDIAKATDGSLFLEYTGVTTDSISLIGVRSGSLMGTVDGVSNIHVGNSGFGYMNLIAGDAFSYFNTDSYCVDNIPGPGCVVADARLDAKASTTNSGAWPLSGIASLKTNAVPEPTSVALLGLGLAGLGFSARKRKA